MIILLICQNYLKGKNVFYDYCHVFEKGNHQIAGRILKEILPAIREKKSRSDESKFLPDVDTHNYMM